jgi:F-box interacting protein
VIALLGEYFEQTCKVLSLEDNAQWRLVQSPPALATSYYQTSVVTVNGIMFFLYRSCIPQMEEDYVLCFDLGSEEWKTSIQGPPRLGDKLQNKTWTRNMVKLNDALCMVQWNSINVWFIWLLTDSAEGTWVKAYTIPMDSPIYLVMPLRMMRDGRKLLFYVRPRFTTTPLLQVYDPLIGTCTHLVKLPSHLLGNVGVCDLHLECFPSPKISPVVTPSVFLT